MKKIKLWIIFLIILLKTAFNLTLPTDFETAQSTKGINFVIGFMENRFKNEIDDINKLVIVNSPENEGPVNVTITSPHENYYETLSIDNSTILSLPSTMQHVDNERSAKGINITSTLPVSVYGINGGILKNIVGSIDTYLTYPVPLLNTEYTLITYSVNDLRGSQFLIIAIEDDTYVELVVTGNILYERKVYTDGSNFSIVLNAMESVQFQSEDDLTGSKLSSSKIISVFSGNKCYFMTFVEDTCDHMASHIPPMDLWGDKYLTTPLASRISGDTFRVLASEDNTTVQISGQSTPAKLNSSQFYDINIPSKESWLILADAPILVAQFCNGHVLDGAKGDSLMMILPSLDNFISGVHELMTFEIINTYDVEYFINIIVNCSATSQFMSALPIPFTWINTTQHLGLCAGTAELSPSAGSYFINASKELKYQVLVYALGNLIGYGHPMALQFSAIEFTDAQGSLINTLAQTHDVGTSRPLITISTTTITTTQSFPTTFAYVDLYLGFDKYIVLIFAYCLLGVSCLILVIMCYMLYSKCFRQKTLHLCRMSKGFRTISPSISSIEKKYSNSL